MDITQKYFDDLLKALEQARVADEELHRRSGSLSERVASHDRLSRLRAEMTQARKARISGPAGTLDARVSCRGSGIVWT